MKKWISLILIFTICFSALSPNFIYAVDKQSYEDVEGEGFKGKDTLFEEGKVSAAGEERSVIETPSMGAAVATILVGIFILPVALIRTILSIVCQDDAGASGFKWFTIENVVFGRIELFDVNFFKDASSSTGVSGIIKDAVANWYYAIRTLAIIFSLLILIYTGIRMAVSTVAEQKAKYKKMLVSWIMSMFLLFILHYIIMLMLFLSRTLVEILTQTPGVKELGFEEKILSDLISKIGAGNGWGIIASFITYVVLTYYQLKFFLMYAKRLLSTAFLVIISPIVTILYPVQKIDDERGDTAYGTWFREIAINIFIQPVHALLYLVFMFSASAIMEKAPILAIIFFFGLSRGEKIIKSVFGMRGAKSIHSMSETIKFSKKK